jgi:hypothetical protein
LLKNLNGNKVEQSINPVTLPSDKLKNGNSKKIISNQQIKIENKVSCFNTGFLLRLRRDKTIVEINPQNASTLLPYFKTDLEYTLKI